MLPPLSRWDRPPPLIERAAQQFQTTATGFSLSGCSGKLQGFYFARGWTTFRYTVSFCPVVISTPRLCRGWIKDEWNEREPGYGPEWGKVLSELSSMFRHLSHSPVYAFDCLRVCPCWVIAYDVICLVLYSCKRVSINFVDAAVCEADTSVFGALAINVQLLVCYSATSTASATHGTFRIEVVSLANVWFESNRTPFTKNYIRPHSSLNSCKL